MNTFWGWQERTGRVIAWREFGITNTLTQNLPHTYFTKANMSHTRVEIFQRRPKAMYSDSLGGWGSSLSERVSGWMSRRQYPGWVSRKVGHYASHASS